MPSMEFHTAFNTYVVLEEIGRGGSGIVYKADDGSGRTFAVKVLDPRKATTEKRKRFKNEIEFCQHPHHQNVLKVLEYGVTAGENDGAPFYVMPLFPSTLRTIIDEKPAPEKVLEYFSQVLAGVEAAHQKSVWHRDLKPENILFDPKENLLVVADFGIAHFSEEFLLTSVETHPHDRLANFAYAAPEQRTKSAPVDHRADIFALGLILNEMFTGQVAQGSGYARIESAAPAFGYVDQVVDRMIQQSPDNRISSARDVRDTLMALAGQHASEVQIENLKKVAIPDVDLDDPLLREPVRITGFDYQSGTLFLTLNQPVNDRWLRAYQGIRLDGIAMHAMPRNFQIHGASVEIRAEDDHVQAYINNFKEYLHRTQEQYGRDLVEDRQSERKQRERKIAQQIEEEETRLRVLKSVRI